MKTLNELLSSASLVYLVIAGLLGWFTLLVTYRLLKATVRLAARALNIFGETPKTRLISLGLASLVFPRVIPQLFLALIEFFSAMFSGLPKALSNDAPSSEYLSSEGFNSNTTKLLFRVLEDCAGVFTKALIAFESVRLDQLALFLASGVIFGIFLRTEEPQQGAGQPRLWLSGYLGSLSPATKKNATFALVLVTASYLSLASLAAIPALQESLTAPTEVSKEKLQEILVKNKAESDGLLNSPGPNPEAFAPFQKWLDEVKKTSTQKPEASVEPSDGSGTLAPAPVAATPGLAAQSATGTPAVQRESSVKAKPEASAETSDGSETLALAPVTPTPGLAAQSATGTPSVQPELSVKQKGTLSADDIRRLQDRLSTARQERRSPLDAYKQRLNALHDGRDSALNTALSTYETENVGRRGSREAVRYFQDITDWYRRNLAALQESVYDVLRSINDGDAMWTERLGGLQAYLVQAKDEKDKANIFAAEYTQAIRSDAYRFVSFRYATEALPERPKLGSYLGPFTFLASWLLAAESLPLALIVGLIGFGLLGSACSTFIRQRDRTRTDVAVVSDLTSVVIPGLSAAVVVFLVVEGGLAIFASNAGQPNPYILFLICLVASVFSEAVWEWAQGWLRERLSGIGGKATEVTLGKTESKPPTENTQPPSDKT